MSLSKYSTEQLETEIKRRENSKYISNMTPIGTWRVTTEGDCEGKTTTNLGVFEGHVVDIAFALADKACYSLRFSKVEPQKPNVENIKRNEVNISFDIETETWDMGIDRRKHLISEMLTSQASKSDYTVIDSQYYASIKLKRQ